MSLNQFQIKNGFGGTSYIDTLSFYRRRPDVETQIVEFDNWMTLKLHNKEKVEINVPGLFSS